MSANVPLERTAGHRQRLRDRFLANENGSRTDEALLELLLAYAIPQQDVQPLAKKLISRFGNLGSVLAASPEDLCAVDGIKTQSAILLKLVDWIRTHHSPGAALQTDQRQSVSEQPTLFDLVPATEDAPVDNVLVQATAPSDNARVGAERSNRRATHQRTGTGLFGKAILAEAIDLLPRLPDSESLEDVKAFLRGNLHFSAQTTRYRNADYIVERMFPGGHADLALRLFARAYARQQTLRDVCYYRFCKAESLMVEVVEELLLPAMGAGRLSRDRLRDYLRQRFPTSAASSIKACGLAVTNAFVAGGVLRANHKELVFAYRGVLLPAFAFVIHSEFPTPGMYDIGALESNRAIRAMLWNPDRILPSLYELRNRGLIAKVSEIDSVRQFTTKWSLEQVVDRLVAGSAQT